MSSTLSSLVDNSSEALHDCKCTSCESCLDYISAKNNWLIFKCIECSKKHEKRFDKDLIERFVSICAFCDGDINKFILLLRKEIYPYEYIDSWERFDEQLLADKEAFYSSLKHGRHYRCWL